MFYEAFRLLRDELAAIAVTSDPRHDLVQLLAMTRQFAINRPMLFEIMFARPFVELEPDSTDVDAAAEIMQIVLMAVSRAQRAGVIEGHRRDIAHVLVSVNRGLIATELAGIAGSSRNKVDRRWRLGIDAVLDGLTPKGP